MYCFFLLTVCIYATASARSVEFFDLEDAHIHFNDFITKFNKQYSHEREKEARFRILKKNLEDVNRLNKESEHASYGITEFLDLTLEEFAAKHSCLLERSYNNRGDFCDIIKTDEDIKNAGAPDAFDWRDRKAVTRVKEQGSCGACWAFSSTGHIESQYFLKYGNLTEFSEQQLVDCESACLGCAGGYMSIAFKGLKQRHGLMTEKDYPYTKWSKCKFVPSKAVAKISDCFSYNLTSQEKVKQLLYKIGPISIAVRSEVLHKYTKGIIMDDHCTGPIHHAVLLVGYGTENGIPYWIVKNSWGAAVGEDGYFRMQRSESLHGACGMLNPLMATATVD